MAFLGKKSSEKFQNLRSPRGCRGILIGTAKYRFSRTHPSSINWRWSMVFLAGLLTCQLMAFPVEGHDPLEINRKTELINILRSRPDAPFPGSKSFRAAEEL